MSSGLCCLSRSKHCPIEIDPQNMVEISLSQSRASGWPYLSSSLIYVRDETQAPVVALGTVAVRADFVESEYSIRIVKEGGNELCPVFTRQARVWRCMAQTEARE